MEIIMKTKFGSNLYGTNTPDSDIDYKGIFLPTKREVFLGKIPKVINKNIKNSDSIKNTVGDIDEEYYSLHYFIKLALKNETIAMDMLHSTGDNLLISSPIWEAIYKYKHKFYSKDLKGFVGYVRSQADKYGIKGSRINAVNDVKEYLLKIWNSDNKLINYWDKFPIGNHVKYIEDSQNGVKQILMAGKTLQSTVTVKYALGIVDKFLNDYGHRAQKAARNEGIDWDAIAHAIRYCYQIKELIETGNISFPLKEAKFILDVKQGKFNFLNYVNPILEQLIEDVNVLVDNCDFPETPDVGFWEDFIVDVYEGV